MPAIKTTKGIAPGKILYHVYGSVIAKGQSYSTDPEKLVEKFIVTSFPKNWFNQAGFSRRSIALSFDVLYESKLGGKDRNSSHCVRDCGIGIGNKYNLNRIFATKTEALEFVSECLCGKFFDSFDQLLYNSFKRGNEYLLYCND